MGAATEAPVGRPPADERIARVERLLDALETLSDGAARELATETVQALLELYGEGLRHVAEAVGASRLRALAQDDLVAHLLLLHGLHPAPVEQRVRDALVGVRPYLESHGGDVELIGVEAGVVHLRLEGSCEGCPASAMTLKLAIEEAILAAAPDVDRVEADGAVEPPASPLLQIHGACPAPAASGASLPMAGA